MKVYLDHLEKLAKAILTYAKENKSSEHASIIALAGDLGAGKTTLVQHLARALGVTEPVVSPTFVLMKRYMTTHPVFTSLVHIDAYRIESEKELAPLHLKRVFADPNALVCIEWPERLGGALPKDTVSVTLTPEGEHQREVSINPDLGPYFKGFL